MLRKAKIPNPWLAACPCREVLGLLGNKSTILILPLLHKGACRNAELLRGADGISQKILTQTLRDLEYRGLVARKDFQTVPPHVEYSLTPLGHSLSKVLDQLNRWVIENFVHMDAARKRFERRRSTR
ncbi:MAG: helix-turn-helix transcriptional regulator [Acidobacteria bacterium]|nr:helix-turn-helix transcriptional regulator [Acidobacteriota bacterium]